MGILESIIKLTPFYNSYKKFKQHQTDLAQRKTETKLFPLRVDFYKQFIKEGDLVFDVGANVGNRVEAFLSCEAKVVAVEPQLVCVQTLRKKFGNKINIENVGLSEKIGELEMQVSNDTTVSTFSKEYINKTKDRFKYSQWEKTISVPVTTMDILIKKYGIPKFCKIDVEGFELQVLKGLHTQIPFLSIEYCVPELQDQAIKCLEYLNTLSLQTKFNYSIGESMKWALQEWKHYEEFLKHVKSVEFTKTSFGDIYIQTL